MKIKPDRIPNRKFVYSILFLVLFISNSCSSTRMSRSLTKQYRHIYIEQFKLTYFRQLLIKSFNNSSAVREIINSDYSGFTEPILTQEDFKIIDSLTTLDNSYLKTDSIAGVNRAEGAHGKRPLAFIMQKLTDKSLDRLAKKRLKLNDKEIQGLAF